MSDEKKDQQEDFLSGHEALLNSIHKNPEAQAEKTKPAAEPTEEMTPVEEEAPAVVEAEADVAQKEEPPVEETPGTEEEPETESVEEELAVEETPEKEKPAIAEEKPVVDETPVEEPVAEEAPAAEPVQEEPEAPAPEPVVEEEEVVDQHVEDKIPPVVTETPAKPAPKKKKPANHAEAVKRRHQATEQAEVKEVLNFIMKYAKPVVAVVVVICVLIIAGSIIKSSQIKKEAAADMAFMEAQTAADYQNILDNYGKTPSAPLALLGLAQQKFNESAVAEAADLYGEFVKKYPAHDNAVQAEYNQINCIEAQGKYAEAAQAYGDFKVAHEKSRFAPQALLDKGRCLEKLNKLAEAKQVYEDVIAFYPNSGWAQLAENNITILNSKM